MQSITFQEAVLNSSWKSSTKQWQDQNWEMSSLTATFNILVNFERYQCVEYFSNKSNKKLNQKETIKLNKYKINIRSTQIKDLCQVTLIIQYSVHTVLVYLLYILLFLMRTNIPHISVIFHSDDLHVVEILILMFLNYILKHKGR